MDDLLNLYGLLADKTRLRILLLLNTRELCVCEIFAALEMSQPRVSRQLALLKQGGYIKDRRKGKWVHYSLDATSQAQRLKTLLDMGLEWIGHDETHQGDLRKLAALDLNDAQVPNCCDVKGVVVHGQ